MSANFAAAFLRSQMIETRFNALGHLEYLQTRTTAAGIVQRWILCPTSIRQLRRLIGY